MTQSDQTGTPRGAFSEVKQCPACNEIYIETTMVVCPKDRTMLLTVNQKPTGDWWFDALQVTNKICLVCHREFRSFTEWLCPHDGTSLRLKDMQLVDAPLLDNRYRPAAYVRQEDLYDLYSGVDEQTNAPVVMKLLHLHLIGDQKTFARFQKYATRTQALDHRNVQKVFIICYTFRGSPILTCEYIEGPTVSEMLSETETLVLDQFLNIFIDACKGLEHAHGQDIYHGSLRNQCIIVAADGRERHAAVCDFGLAARLFQDVHWDGPKVETHTVNVYGDSSNMCPDFSKGVPPSATTDQYQLGCSMYEAINGKVPFARDTAIATVFAHLSDKPDKFRRSVPEALQEIILRCLGKTPEDRFESIAAVRQELEKLKI